MDHQYPLDGVLARCGAGQAFRLLLYLPKPEPDSFRITDVRNGFQFLEPGVQGGCSAVAGCAAHTVSGGCKRRPVSRQKTALQLRKLVWKTLNKCLHEESA